MNADELIEKEAEFLCNNYGQEFSNWTNLANSRKPAWRRRALAHFKALNEWGVVRKANNQSVTMQYGVSYTIPTGFVRVEPLLPDEAKEGPSLTHERHETGGAMGV